MTFWSWSKTAATNATADSTINWAEGQAPSSVNDSARAVMAAAAKYRDDISGAIVTGGSSTAYTVTSFEVFDTLAHMNGAMLAFTPHTTNGATVTLNVDGIGAKPLRSAPNVELPSGTLIQGTPYVATYNNSDSAWYLQGGVGNPYSIPLGGMLPYTGTTAPNSAFALPFGQAISRTTYSTYYSLVGTTYGVGDGSTTFNVIDVRGTVPAGVDNMGGSSGGRFGGLNLGTFQGAITHTIGTVNLPPYTPAGSVSGSISGSASNGQVTTKFTTSETSGPVAPTIVNGNADGRGLTVTGSIAATFSGTAQGGTSTPITIVQPTIGVNYILRII